MTSRVYLDWNAAAPLRREARAAMLEAMDAVGNPASVHVEGRTARAILERARSQVAALAGAEPSEIVFTSGASEAVATVAAQGWDLAVLTGLEHEAVQLALSPAQNPAVCEALVCHGAAGNDALPGAAFWDDEDWDEIAAEASSRPRVLIAVTGGDGETGLTDVAEDTFPALAAQARGRLPGAEVTRFSDITQRLGKAPFDFHDSGLDLAAAAAQKIGGPKGVGCLIARRPEGLRPLIHGGGQESMHRAGTENLIGIAGFGAAAEAAGRDLAAGLWEQTGEFRNLLERSLADAAGEAMFFGQEWSRLANTSCFAVPGWGSETQLMQMDLAGFAVSAGSACSSGKISGSRVLRAMGHDERVARSAIRVSLGPATTEDEVRAFAEAWGAHYRRRKARAA